MILLRTWNLQLWRRCSSQEKWSVRTDLFPVQLCLPPSGSTNLHEFGFHVTPNCLLWSLLQKAGGLQAVPVLTCQGSARWNRGCSAIRNTNHCQAFVFLCFLLWIPTRVTQHNEAGVTKGHQGTVLCHLGPAPGDISLTVPTGPFSTVPLSWFVHNWWVPWGSASPSSPGRPFLC